ncbi:MAG TPA: hypothetical protein VGD46_15315 [Rhizobacter sp.]
MRQLLVTLPPAHPARWLGVACAALVLAAAGALRAGSEPGERHGPGATAACPALDVQRLFRDAAEVHATPMRTGGIVLMRSGRFADGSELRLTRFVEPYAASRYLALLASSMPTEPFDEGGRGGWRVRGPGVGDTLVVYEQHGADVLELRARDLASGLARLAAQQVPVPEPVEAAQPSPTPNAARNASAKRGEAESVSVTACQPPASS